MNRIESEEASNDTTIISELLYSAEELQTSTIPSSNASTVKMPLQQKDELQIVSNTGEISATICEATKENIMASLQKSLGMVDSGFLNSTQYSDMKDINKLQIRHVHIPYILNGELYQIQTQDGENVTVKCCHCPPDRVYRGSVRSTGNFHMHIKRRHPDLLEKLHNMKVNALLERRDRLMRNRKITHRNNRNRSSNAIVNSNDMCLFKNAEKSELTTTMLDSTSESSLMHTHKLKIKTVFQRHQMQQREAEELQNWKNADYVVMPIGKIPGHEDTEEQPINYSIKPQGNHENVKLFSSNFSNDNEQPQQQQENNKTNDTTTQTSFDNFKNVNLQSTNLSTNNAAEHNNLICGNPTLNRNLSTSSISCPSVMSSYSSGHQYDVLETSQFYNSFPLKHHNLSIIKPEHLLSGAESEAIDLTMRTDSGIFSNSEDNDYENNNNYNSRFNNIRAGTQDSNTAINAGNNSQRCQKSTAKWQELLMQVKNSLCEIQHEMNVRNQIESNRMFLDIAKFKYLNPGFQFNW